MSGFNIPVDLAVLGFFGVIGGAAITGWFTLTKGKKIDAPSAAFAALLQGAPALLSSNLAAMAETTRLTGEVNAHLNTIEALKDDLRTQAALLAAVQTVLDRTAAERDLALLGQATAEGGYRSARQTITELCSPATDLCAPATDPCAPADPCTDPKQTVDTKETL